MEAGEFRAELVFLRGGGMFQPLATPRRQPAAVSRPGRNSRAAAINTCCRSGARSVVVMRSAPWSNSTT
jgi:hypothetical protein